MQNRIAERSTWEEKHLYQQHIDNLINAQPKVDNKAPILNMGMYYKPGIMKTRALKLSQIEENNFTLIKNINIIYRTHGKVDCLRPKSMNNIVTNMEMLVKKNKKIFKQNIELWTKIVNAKSRIDGEKNKKDYKRHVEMQLFMTKHPEHYKRKIGVQSKRDPLIPAGLLKNVHIKKSKCYLDVSDCTAGKPMGRLTVELYDGVVPVTAANFTKLCRTQENGAGYAGTQFFRIVPGLFCLAGDIEYSIGVGGRSAADTGKGRRNFDDENHSLSHNAPGTLSMYNFEKNKNASQFLITFKPLTTLDGRYVVFGRVIIGMNTLKSIEDLGLKSGKPKHKVVISKCGTFECSGNK